MTTLATVTNELKRNNFQTTGSMEALPKKTLNLVINILHFGEAALKSSSLGSGVKTLALEIAQKDGRKAVQCPNTLKTILA